jgi:hypothetical protein
MSKFMVVFFDRYTASHSDYAVVEAETQQAALKVSFRNQYGTETTEEEIADMVKETHLEGGPDLWGYDNEEESILVIKL